MSVLTRLEATPSRIHHLLALLADRPAGETEERLRDFCSPEALLDAKASEPYSVYRSTIGAARDLGLIESLEDRVKIRSDLVARRGGLAGDLRNVLESILLAPDASPDDPQRDFGRAVAWFLMQPARKPIAFATNQKLTIENQLVPGAPTFDLSNPDRWNTFFYWCRYLGYGEALTNRALAPDPTEALRRLIPRAMADERDLPAAVFLRRLSGVSPVFEGGAVRTEVEALALPAFARETPRLSQSTSFALVRLEREGLLKLTAPSDAAPTILDLGPDPARRFSQVTLLDLPA